MIGWWLRRLVTILPLLVVGLLVSGLLAMGVFVYAYDHQFDGDKATMRALIARDLAPGASPTTVTRFVRSPQFRAIRYALRFDAAYSDAQPVPVASSISNLPVDHSVPSTAIVIRIELDRYADDVKMDVTLLFDGRGRYTRSIIDESGPTV